MTYTAKEQSLIESEPIELYSFRKSTTYWTYNNSNLIIPYGGRIYTPVLIRRNDIELTTNSLKNLLSIEVDRTNEFAKTFISTPLEDIIELTLYRGHGVLPANYTTYWKGFVYVVSFKPEIATIVASPISNSLKRTALMRKYQRSCGYALYSTRCTMLKSNYKRIGTVISIDGTKIEASIFGTETDGWFRGGKFESGVRSQMIVWHVGNFIRTAHKIQSLEVGNSFSAYAGCNHAASTCKDKFNNKINYGGQEHIPNKNPFIGDSVGTHGGSGGGIFGILGQLQQSGRFG